MTAKEAAVKVLEEVGTPLHYEALTEHILEKGNWETEGQTPAATVNAQLATSIKKRGEASPFQRVSPGVFALRSWDLPDKQPEDPQDESRVHVPLFPEYDSVRHLLRIMNGEPRNNLLTLFASIREQRGTPQNPVNWKDPDDWIHERMEGPAQRIAQRIWEMSDREVNPRYVRGAYFLIERYHLLEEDSEGIYRLTERGRAFAENKRDAVQRIDEHEGLGELLSILATKTRAQRADLIPEWGDYLHTYSAFGSTSTIKDTLRRRIVNLLERGYIEREGHTYVITEDGIAYARVFAEEEGGSPREDVQHALRRYNDAQRAKLREYLGTMDPYLFEYLINDLLEAMGYQDVEVTQQSGDRGVDVVGTVQFGITTVREVVQVKRQQGTISRPKLDQLRGALPYHEAIRGTIITLGRFSKQCKESALFAGAAPITLIDGDRLLDLLVEHEIGIQKRPVLMYDFDEQYFAEQG